MLIEQLIFIIVAFALFIFMFYKMIKYNDTTYVIILVLEAIGITINFISVIGSFKLNIVLKLIMWSMSVLLPLVIILLEKKNITLFETFHQLKAEIYIKLGNNKKAKQELITIINRNPGSYKAHKRLAEVYELEGGMRKAIDEYVQAIDIKKNDYDSYYKVAGLLNDLDKKDEASQMLVNLLDKKPEYVEASKLLGEIYIEREMYKEAVNVYQDALKYNLTDYELYYGLGIAFTMLNDFQNAKNAYQKAAELNSLIYNSKYSLAEIALIFKELEEAKERFLQATEDEELAADAYFELSKISLIQLDKEAAIRYANLAIELDAPKIVEKIKNDSIFIPIMAKISIPFNIIENEEKQTKMKPIEKKAKEHLEEMFDITRNLSYNDIRLLKKNREKEQDLGEKNIDYNQREIQE